MPLSAEKLRRRNPGGPRCLSALPSPCRSRRGGLPLTGRYQGRFVISSGPVPADLPVAGLAGGPLLEIQPLEDGVLPVLPPDLQHRLLPPPLPGLSGLLLRAAADLLLRVGEQIQLLRPARVRPPLRAAPGRPVRESRPDQQPGLDDPVEELPWPPPGWPGAEAVGAGRCWVPWACSRDRPAVPVQDDPARDRLPGPGGCPGWCGRSPR